MARVFRSRYTISGIAGLAVAAGGITTYNFANKNTLPEKVPYVIVGGGPASYYAALTIRGFDADAKVLILSADNQAPYNRQLLSRECLLYDTGKTRSNLEYIGVTGKKREIHFESDKYFLRPGALADYKHGGIALMKNTRVTKIDPEHKEVTIQNGKTVKYDKLLLATGGTPQIPHPFYSPHLANKVMTYNSITDYQRLYDVCQKANSVFVYGHSLVGPDLAMSLKQRFSEKDLKVVYGVSYEHPYSHCLPRFLAECVEKVMTQSGVDVRSSCRPIAVDKLPNGKVRVTYMENDKKKVVDVDHVVVTESTMPAGELAESAGLRMAKDGGVATDSMMRTSNPDIFAAGDIAEYENYMLGTYRGENYENAQITGRLAGQNMTGNLKKFHHMFASSAAFGHSIHLFTIGVASSSLKMYSVFTPFDKNDPVSYRGVVFYANDKGIIVGVVLCNIFGFSTEIARKIIADQVPVDKFVDLAKAFDLYPVVPPENEEEHVHEELDEQTSPVNYDDAGNSSPIEG